MGLGWSFRDGDWQRLRQIIQKIASIQFGPDSIPTFAGLTLSGLTGTRLIATDAGSTLVSSDLYGWVTETANQVLVADDGDGTITLSAPQDIHTSASPTFAGLTLSSPLTVGNGGTGLTSLTAGYIPYGAGESAFASSANLTFASNILNTPFINIPTTGPVTTPTAGIIYQNSARVFHTYGTQNMFIGKNSGNFTATATGSVGLGEDTLQSLTSGFGNMCIGFGAGKVLTTGESNVCIGTWAGNVLNTGSYNMLFGRNAGVKLTTGADNVAIGTWALTSGITSTRNVAIGSYALVTCTGNYNVGIGQSAGYSIGAADYNVTIGNEAGYNIGVGTQNVVIGAAAGLAITNGVYNVIIGTSANGTAAATSCIVALGQSARAANYSVAIGYATYVTGTNSIGLGESATTAVNNQMVVNKINTYRFQATADTDITFSFIATTNSGELKWMEDEDRFQFSDAVLMDTTLGVTGLSTLTGGAVIGTAASDPQDATPANRPAGVVAQLMYYSGKLYFCINAATPTWELITSA